MIWTSSYSSCANPHLYSFVDICCSCLVAQAPKCSWFNHPPYCWPRPLHFHPHKILPDLQSGAHAKDRNCTLPRLNRSQSWKHRQPNLKAITRNDSKWFQMFPTEKQLETIWTQQNPGKPLRKSTRPAPPSGAAPPLGPMPQPWHPGFNIFNGESWYK